MLLDPVMNGGGGWGFPFGKVLLVTWLALISVIVVWHFVYCSLGTVVSSPMVPVIETKKDQIKREVNFNLVPSKEVGSGRIMNLSLPDIEFERVLRYDVCCFQKAYFACRSITKNLGVDCYLTNEKMAVIQVFHPDMVGARCTLMWTEKT